MRRRNIENEDHEADDFDDASWDDGLGDDDAWNDDDDKATVPCPYCRQPVYEDAEYCANCQEYISLEDAPPEQKPPWIVITVLLLLSSMLLWILF